MKFPEFNLLDRNGFFPKWVGNHEAGDEETAFGFPSYSYCTYLRPNT